MNAAVDATKLRRAIARTPLAPVAAFPKRLARVARHDAKVLRTSARWLVTSREHHNYTYELTKLSRHHLAWFVSVVCDCPVKQVRGVRSTRSSPTSRCGSTSSGPPPAPPGAGSPTSRSATPAGSAGTPSSARPDPAHVVETGVDKGLGSCVLAAALLRNAAEGHPGRLTSLDINPEAGYLARSAPWSEVVDLVIGDSIASIGALDRPVDLFLHDSDHSRAHEKREFDAVEPKLAPGAILLTDNVTATNVLAEHAERTGRRFLAYRESPANHWYPGDGIGVAW